jgi:branched-chain amino acid transport system substrate-binding protein
MIRQTILLSLVLPFVTCIVERALAAEYSLLVLEPLTGSYAFVGVPLKDGMMMAVDEINSKNLLGQGNSLKVYLEDDATDRTMALTQVNRYAVNPNILAIMGPTFTPVAIPAVQAANEQKIVALVTTNTDEIPKSGPWGFRLTQPAPVTIPYMARYVVDKLKSKACVIVNVQESEAFVQQTHVFSEYVTQRGVKILSTEGVKLSDSDFSALATKIVQMDPDCIFIAGTAQLAGNLITQLRTAGLNSKTQITGQNAMASPDLVKFGGKAVEGVFLFGDWVPGGSTDEGREFAADYTKRYGSPPDNWGPIGYTGMMAMAQAIKSAGPNPTREGVRDALAKVSIPTILGDGTYTFDSARAGHYGMKVLVVKEGRFVAAPE